MSNASRCRKTATRFGLLAEITDKADERSAYQELRHLWSVMARLAERFDRQHDADAKARIYALMGQVDSVRRKHHLTDGMPHS
jgi:hypothetical protein